MLELQFDSEHLLSLPPGSPFESDEHACDLFFTLREALAQADARRQIRYVHFHAGEFFLMEVPPANPRELHLVCLPEQDPVIARSEEYSIIQREPDPQSDTQQIRWAG